MSNLTGDAFQNLSLSISNISEVLRDVKPILADLKDQSIFAAHRTE